MANSARLQTRVKQRFVLGITTNRYRIRKQRAQIGSRDQAVDEHRMALVSSPGFAITGTTLVWENGVRRVMRVAVVLVVVVVMMMMVLVLVVVVGSY